MGTFQSLRIEGHGAIAELTLLGPGRGNAMGPDFWRELPQAVAQIEADGAVRAIIVRGSGEHFSYRSEEHTSELQSLMRISYAVFCLKKKKQTNNTTKK